MDLRLAVSKPLSGSQTSARRFWDNVSPFECKTYPRISSCNMASSRSTTPHSSTDGPTTTASLPLLQLQGYLSWITGINGKTISSAAFSCGSKSNNKLLDALDDEYDGVVIIPDRLPSKPDAFASMLHSSISHWKIKGKKGVWLKLPVEYSELVPVAIKEGFEYHHAEKGYVMLTYWIPEGPCLLPANASHQVGVGGFVINDKNEVLVVQEKYCGSTAGADGCWKIPTGFILESEEIFTGAVREVEEETGVETEFIEVIAFRHAQNMAFEKSDLFFICMLKALSTDIKIDNQEIQAAKWMPLIEFVEQPPVREDHMFKKVIDIFIARLGQKYCGLFAHQLVSKFDGRSSTLYYNVTKDPDSGCQAD